MRFKVYKSGARIVSIIVIRILIGGYVFELFQIYLVLNIKNSFGFSKTIKLIYVSFESYHIFFRA